jgi:hypothetical protein
VVVAETSDGVTLSNARQVLDHASVPDGVQTRDGEVLVYYVNGAHHGVYVAKVAAGAATVIGPITIDGVERPNGVVDPDATLLPDGRIRLAYLSGFGSPGVAEPRSICLADSDDGRNFRVVGEAIRFETLTTDPSLVRMPDGTWLLAVSQGEHSVLARSSDGLRFTEYKAVDYGGIPELALTEDGRVRLYVCTRGGMDTYLSDAAGQDWRKDRSVRTDASFGKLGCDPSLVAGAGLFVFKTAD